MELKKILMPTDFSDCAQAALGHALLLAEQFEAELHLLHVVVLHEEDPFNPASQFPDADEIYGRLQSAASAELRGLIDAHRDRTLHIREAQRRGIAAGPEIVAYVEEIGADLVVMGAHGRRGLRRLLLGSVAEEVVRTAPCPVLTLRSEEGSHPVEGIERILVPVDFSPASRRALEAARELAAIYSSRLEVVHVVEPPIYPQYYEPLFPPVGDYTFPQMAVVVEDGLADFVRETGGPEVEIHLEVLEGRVAEGVTTHATESDTDLIVIATHGHTGLERFLLGSVAEKVVRQAECPVLTLKVPAED